MSFKKVSFEHLLASVLKPSRYINQEINSFHKIPDEDTVNFCLVFPDVYEVGFSHLGLKILYTILNTEPDTVADRAYTPWPDFGKKLLEHKLPLFGLESKIPLKNFDIIGFTLQTELTFTNILYTLELGQISILSKDRKEEEPIILGGGPNTTNPEPLADFFDAFLIGDGEEAILEIKNSIMKSKKRTRKEKLQNLSEIEGVYVPSLYDIQDKPEKIKVRKYLNFGDMKYIYQNQLKPWTLPTHYRCVYEIMRGCSRGCRFCHAGMFYRPVRESNPEDIVSLLYNEIKKNGWNEAALTSLSSSDYTCIKPVLFELYSKLTQTKTTLSLPSLRIDTIDNDLIKLLNSMNQTGLTVAPEAGTQRLRNIINKNISEDDIIKAVKIALDCGWKVIKLYFMIGLPFEKDSDVQGIIKLINKIIEITKKRIKINVTISPFVPKTFTPFQWAGMDNKESLQEKAHTIKNTFIRFKFIKIRYHEISSSILECVLGRGDRKIGKLIYSAYKKGAIYDGWLEYFNFQIWEQASVDLGLDFESYLFPIPLKSKLPWDHIDIGINKDFLISEWEKAKQEIYTEDCRNGKCSGCGVCEKGISPEYVQKTKIQKLGIIEKRNQQSKSNFFYRVFYSKMKEMRFVAHLDLIRMTQTFMRASGLPIVYTQGFKIHPKLNFGPPLSVGIQGENEYFDFALFQKYEIQKLETILKKNMPSQITLHKILPVQSKTMQSMEYYPYELIIIEPDKKFNEKFKTLTVKFLKVKKWEISRIRKGKEKISNLKQIIHSITWNGKELEIIKKRVGASVFDILKEVYEVEREKTSSFNIIRKKLIHKI